MKSAGLVETAESLAGQVKEVAAAAGEFKVNPMLRAAAPGLAEAIPTTIEALKVTSGLIVSMASRLVLVEDWIAENFPCESCGETEFVELCADPYHEDVDGEIIPKVLCTDCYKQACDDI